MRIPNFKNDVQLTRLSHAHYDGVKFGGRVSRTNFRVILLCFFLSGLAGLIYEVAWTKALGLVFGHTVYAIATVLAAFMAGLAAGSIYLGRWGGRHRRQLALYGWIELLVAATGAFSLFGLSAVGALYVATYHLVAGSMPVLESLRFIASILVLFLPTFLMGGTLPILASGVTRNSSEMGAQLGRLYGVNTAGAVLGALAAGFLLLPLLGLRLTVGVAVLANLVAGALALRLASSSEVQTPEESPIASPTIAKKVPAFLLIAFGLVGATAMAYEISWTRLLATTLGSSTFAFTIMLATFLAGIALGSWLFEIWVSRGKEISVATFGVTQIFIGLAAVAFLLLFSRLPAISWGLVTVMHKNFGGLLLTQFVVSGLAMFPAAVVFGFNFPAVILLIAGRQQRTPSYAAYIGRAIAANTFGAIVGSVLAGFWLAPRLGSFRLVAMTAALNLVLAVWLFAQSKPRRGLALAASAVLATLVAAAGWTGFLYDPLLANFSVTNHPEGYPAHVSAEEIARTVDLLYTEEGLNATIAVTQSENNLALRTNGKTDASTRDQTSQLLLGHLGLLFNKSPRKVLVIGFGGGMTVSAVARYPDVQQIDCVEIEPAVLHASPYLAPLNRGVLSDPRLHLITDDARNFLFTTSNQYDVIISEPSNPWIAGIAALFTDEFYRQVRSRLAPGGVLVQWVQAYAMFPRDVKMILATLSPHFPQVSVWRGSAGDFLLLAQADPGPLLLDRLRQFWALPQLQEDYATFGLEHPEGLLAYHMLDDADLRRLIVNTPANTDDLTRLEYRAPLAIFADNTIPDNMRMFTQQRSSLFPASLPVADDAASLLAAAQTAMHLEDYERAGQFLSRLSLQFPTVEMELLRAQWFLSANNLAEARSSFESAQRLDPSSLPALMGLANVALDARDYDRAERWLREILDRQPAYLPALEACAILEARRGHTKEALAWQTKRVLADASRPFKDVLLLAGLSVINGDKQNAERAYLELLHRDPYSGPTRLGLGELYRGEQHWDEARVQFEALVRYYPTVGVKAYLSLAEVYKRLGRERDAKSSLRKAARIFPGEASPLHAFGTP